METILSVKDVSKSAGKFQILKRISFELKKGEIVGLIGPNGAGKTSIMKIIVGLTRKYDGEVMLGEKEHIGCMIEAPNFYPYLSGYDNLKYFAKLSGVPDSRVLEVMELLGLSEAAKRKVKNYSLGMRQRLGIAQALLRNPGLLILDEPTNGLDPAGIYEIREYIRRIAREKNITVLISSHLLGELQKLCDRALVIKDGQLIEKLDMKEEQESDLEQVFLKLVNQ